jgi:hypothetical protein
LAESRNTGMKLAEDYRKTQQYVDDTRAMTWDERR